MSALRFIVYPAVGSFLGFITNFIAIKLLFRPRKKTLGIQGLLPKNKQQIAARAGEIVQSHLINGEAISGVISRKRLEEAVSRYIESSRFIPNVALFTNTATKIIVSLLVDDEGRLNRRILESFIDDKIFSDVVEKKINEFDVTSLEAIVKKASGPEMNFILLSGAILGCFIGIVQAFIGL